MAKPLKGAMTLAWMRYLVARLGWSGLLGLALMVGAGAGWLAAWQVATDNLELQRQAADLRGRLAARPAALPESEARRLDVLPGGAALIPLVAAVHAAARGRQVNLDEGEYAWQKESAGSGGRYRMLFPARGTYPQLRGWVADVLSQRPELILEEFSFRRDNIGAGEVEARVRFSARVEDRQS